MNGEQEELFAADDYRPREADSLPYTAADPDTASAALAGDRYAWITAILPMPRPLICEGCRQPMSLARIPIVWTCPRCYPKESAR